MITVYRVILIRLINSWTLVAIGNVGASRITFSFFGKSACLYCFPGIGLTDIFLLVFFRSKGLKKYNAIDKWNTQLRVLYQSVANKIGWYLLVPILLHPSFVFIRKYNGFWSKASSLFTKYAGKKVCGKVPFVYFWVILLWCVAYMDSVHQFFLNWFYTLIS